MAVFWHTVTPGRLAVAQQGGEDPPQSAVIGMQEHCTVTSERREQGGCGETGRVPPDKAKTWGSKGGRGGEAELRPKKARVTAGRGATTVVPSVPGTAEV